MSTAPQSGADILARIKPRLREESTQICLRPDLLDAWEEANEELMASQQEDIAARRLASGTSEGTRLLAEKVQQIEAEIEENALRVTFRAIPKDEWTLLCEQYPPRIGNEIDAIVGYDRDGVADASVRACMVDPVFDDASWAEFVKVCNPGEWNELKNVAAQVNRAVTSVPKSAWAERALSKRAGGSKPPASGE